MSTETTTQRKISLKDRVSKNINPAYKRMFNDFSRGIETNHLYLSPQEIVLPHGRGAGATSATIYTILYGIEKDWEYKQNEIENWKNHEWVEKRRRNLPHWHIAEKQNRNITGHSVIIRKDFSGVKWTMENVAWCIEHLGLTDKYQDFLLKRKFQRKESGANIYVMTVDEFNRFKGQFKYLFFDELDELDKQTYFAFKTKALVRLNDSVNTFCFSAYNVPASTQHWTYPIMTTRKNSFSFKKYHATYLTMPKDWLGSRFFDEANYLKKTNRKLYDNEYLGKATTIFSEEK